MSENSLIPADSAEDPSHEKEDAQRQEQPPQSSPPPDEPVMTRQECLQAMRSLSGAVALGVLSPSQANSMRASYMAILNDHYRSAPQGASAGLTDEGVLATLRQAPELLSVYREFLTPAQLDLIMREFKDESAKTEKA